MPKSRPVVKKLMAAKRIQFQGKTESKKANLRAKPVPKVQPATNTISPITNSTPQIPQAIQPQIKIIGPQDLPMVPTPPVITKAPEANPTPQVDMELPKPKRIKNKKRVTREIAKPEQKTDGESKSKQDQPLIITNDDTLNF